MRNGTLRWAGRRADDMVRRDDEVGTMRSGQFFVVERQYSGFAGQALGGYVGGVMSVMAGLPLEVSLRAPVPVEVPLQLDVDDAGVVRVLAEDRVLAEGIESRPQIQAPPPPPLDAARSAAARYPGFDRHLFPTCFCCGPGLAEGEGLRIFPGRVGESPIVAARWEPDPVLAGSQPTVPDEIIWSALDCPAIWALIISAPSDSEQEIVSGRLATQVLCKVETAQAHVVLGWPIGSEGRKLFAGAALFSGQGELLAISHQTCVLVARGAPLGLNRWATTL
jgi:hypothetical protein